MKPETKRTDLDLHLIIMVFLIILNLCCRKVQGSKSNSPGCERVFEGASLRQLRRKCK